MVLWDWPHSQACERSCPLLCWEPQWFGVGPGHIIRIASFLTIEMCDLGPGMNQGTGTNSRLPFQHFWLQKRQFMLYIFLSCFRFNNPSCNVFFLCPFLSCLHQILVFHVHRFLQPPREQSRDQTRLAILKLSIPVENVGLSNSEVQFVREKVGVCMAGISSDLLCLCFWRTKEWIRLLWKHEMYIFIPHQTRCHSRDYTCRVERFLEQFSINIKWMLSLSF